MRQDFFSNFLIWVIRRELNFFFHWDQDRESKEKIRLLPSLTVRGQNYQIWVCKNGGCAEIFLSEFSQVWCDLKTALCRSYTEESSEEISWYINVFHNDNCQNRLIWRIRWDLKTMFQRFPNEEPERSYIFTIFDSTCKRN